MDKPEGQPKKKMSRLMKLGIILGAIIFFAVIGSLASPSNDNSNTNTSTISPTTNTPVLAQHKVKPEAINGTTRRITVIVQPDITKQQLTDINDSLKTTYSSGLTHLTIEYFDDEAVSTDYFQKIINASASEGDKMFVHYRATYTINQTSGVNKLEWNEPPTSASLPAGVDNNKWITIKTY